MKTQMIPTKIASLSEADFNMAQAKDLVKHLNSFIR